MAIDPLTGVAQQYKTPANAPHTDLHDAEVNRINALIADYVSKTLGGTIIVPPAAGGLPGLTFRFVAGSHSQAIIFFDVNGAPIFVIPNAGGPKVFGDNFSVHNGSDVFNAWIKLRQDGSIKMSKGDFAGGVGVFAIGAVTTPPTGKPDGTHTDDGAVTQAGAVAWSDSNGRVFIMQKSGLITSVAGARPVGSANVGAVGDWLTPGCQAQGSYPMSAADVNRMFLIPVDVTDPTAAYNKVGSLASTPGAGGTFQQFRYGIYQDDGTLQRPNLALQLADFGLGSNGFTSLQATTPVTTLTSAYSFPNAGRFWLAAWYQVSGTPTTYPTITTAQSALLASGGDLSTAGRGWYVAGVSGSLPTSGTLVSTPVVPFVGLRRSA